jgi:hypothetical protein
LRGNVVLELSVSIEYFPLKSAPGTGLAARAREKISYQVTQEHQLRPGHLRPSRELPTPAIVFSHGNDLHSLFDGF